MLPFFYLESTIVQAEAPTDHGGALAVVQGQLTLSLAPLFDPQTSAFTKNGHQRSQQDNDDPSESKARTWKKLEVPPLSDLFKFNGAHQEREK